MLSLYMTLDSKALMDGKVSVGLKRMALVVDCGFELKLNGDVRRVKKVMI